jgi:hypothetical protein
MTEYKRNQLEDAIARLSGDLAAQPSSELLTRIKRLLNTDRALAVLPKSPRSERANYAFFSGRSPGKGTEVPFSDYEAFAVLIGLQMLNHNWPQKFVVETLRRLRPKLEKPHREILRRGPAQLRDEDQSGLGARPGDLALAAVPSPVFLLIWSDQRTAENPAPSAEIFFDDRAAFTRTLERAGRSSTWIELTRPAHLLSEQLSRTAPRKRGRS